MAASRVVNSRVCRRYWIYFAIALVMLLIQLLLAISFYASYSPTLQLDNANHNLPSAISSQSRVRTVKQNQEIAVIFSYLMFYILFAVSQRETSSQKRI